MAVAAATAMAPNNGASDNRAPAIRASGLTKRYGATTAVDAASFEVRRGDIYGFLGPNGSGKSTTIAMLLGLIEPTSGRVELFGCGPERRAEGLARTGAIIETPAFYPYLSGRENLRVLAQLRPGVTRARVDETLDIVGLREAANRRFGAYSLGMKQRLGVAWTLLHDPELLILDEPTNGLDPAGMLETRHLLLRLAAAGKTIFISSHLLNEIEQVCDRVAIILRGRVVAEGAVADLVGRERGTLIGADDPRRAREVLAGLPAVERVEARADGLLVTAPGVGPADLNAALVGAGVAVHELRATGNTLEAAFLELTGADADAAPRA